MNPSRYKVEVRNSLDIGHVCGSQKVAVPMSKAVVAAEKALFASLLSLLVLFGASCEPIPLHVVVGYIFLLGITALWFTFMLISAIACPLLASKSGRDPLGYFFLGFFLSMVGLVITVWVTGRPFSTLVKIIGIPILVVSVILLFFHGVGIIVFVALSSIAGVLAGLTWLLCFLIDTKPVRQEPTVQRTHPSQWQ